MKKLSIILVTILLVMTMFVSCSVEVNEPETNLMSLRFRTDDDASKALTASRDSFDTTKYVWYYEATKSDTTTPATGTTTEITIVGTNGNLSELVGPFSLGKWNFTLYGYVSGTTEPDEAKLVYKGSVTGYTLTATTETIEVTVEPQKTTGGTGTLRVEKSIGFTANNQSYTATNITVTNVDGTDSYTAIESTDSGYDASYDTFSLNVGSYKVTVAYIDSSTNITHATNTIYVNVWNGLTTTISGTLDEITVYERFNATENEDGSLEQAVSINTTSSDTPTATNYVFSYSPASTNLSTIVKGTFTKTDGTTGDATLTVTTYDISSANSNSDFVVTSSTTESPVAGIDLTLTNAEFYTNSVAIITTTIAKGLTEPNLYHKTSDSTTTMTQVDSADAVVSNGQWYYNSTDGTLVFATSSFSSFFVSSKDETINMSTNTAYETLVAGVSAAKSGEKLQLLKDITLMSTVIAPTKDMTLDMAGYDISLKNMQNKTAGITIDSSNTNVIISNSSDKESTISVSGDTLSGSEYCHGASLTLPSDDSKPENSSLTIGKDVVITAPSGIFVGQGTLNIYGSIKAVKQDSLSYAYAAISGNGQEKYFDTVINLYAGAIIESDRGPAILQQQRGTLNIMGATVKGYAGIGIKSGTLNISNGSTIIGQENDDVLGDEHSSNTGIGFDGSAIVIDSAVGYDGNMNITISDSTIKSLYSWAIKEIQSASMTHSNVVSLNISGDNTKFVSSKENGGISVKNKDTVNITGGTFTTNPTYYVNTDSYNVNEDSSSDPTIWMVSAK